MALDPIYGINRIPGGMYDPAFLDPMGSEYPIFSGSDLDLLEALLGLDIGGYDDLYGWELASLISDKPGSSRPARAPAAYEEHDIFAEHREESTEEQGFFTSGIKGFLSNYTNSKVIEFGERAPSPNEYTGEIIHDNISPDSGHHAVRGSEKIDYIYSTGDVPFGDLSIKDTEAPGIVYREGSAKNTEIDFSGLLINNGRSTQARNRLFNPNTTEIYGSDNTNDVIYDRGKAESTLISGGAGDDTYIGDLRGSTSGIINIERDVEKAIFIVPEGHEIKVEEDNQYRLYQGDTATDRIINYDMEYSKLEFVDESNQEHMEAVQSIVETTAKEIANIRGDV